MLTKRYLSSTKNLPAILEKIVQGTAPEKFTTEHLRGLGFKSSNDRAVIPLLKDLGFLSDDGSPTNRYHEYRDPSRSRAVLGEALREAYEDLFHISEKPTSSDRKAILGKFKTAHNVSDRVAELQTSTFFALLKLADLDGHNTIAGMPEPKVSSDQDGDEKNQIENRTEKATGLSLRYNIEIHLPATKDVEVYNAIFKALKTYLGE